MTLFLRLLLGAWIVAAAASGGTIYIDTFGCANSASGSGVAANGISCGTSIGGARIDFVNGGGGLTTVQSNPPLREIDGNASTPDGGEWEYLAAWDGSTTNTLAFGLGNIDLTGGGSDNAIDVSLEWSGNMELQVALFTNGSQESNISMELQGAQSGFVDLNFPFAAFFGSPSADFQDINDIWVILGGNNAGSFAIQSVSSVSIPEPSPAFTLTAGIAVLLLLRRLNARRSGSGRSAGIPRCYFSRASSRTYSGF